MYFLANFTAYIPLSGYNVIGTSIVLYTLEYIIIYKNVFRRHLLTFTFYMLNYYATWQKIIFFFSEKGYPPNEFVVLKIELVGYFDTVA